MIANNSLLIAGWSYHSELLLNKYSQNLFDAIASQYEISYY